MALVSDAGTPGLNDPGFELVCAALDAGHTVSPIPGPSAPVAALVASGLPTDAFLYLGYLPRKAADRRRILDEIAKFRYTLVFLETPHRLLSALADLKETLGDRQIAAARELTKFHEEIYRGKISEAAVHFSQSLPRGEFTLVVAGAPHKSDLWLPEQVESAIKDGLARGESPSQNAKEIASQSGWNRRDVYNLIMEIQSH